MPRGQIFTLLTGSANRNLEKFEVPDRLDVGRETRGHLSFGLGVHYCLGAPSCDWKTGSYSKRCWNGSRPCVCSPSAPAFCNNIVLRGLKSLPVNAVPA